MKYSEGVTKAMTTLAKKKDTIFLGENVINAGRLYGTLNGVPKDKCIEMPICENLIASSAIGLALEGYHPVVVFQRMDFMLIASDAIINHMCMMPEYSGGQIELPIIIRTVIGSRKLSFDVGTQHCQDHTLIFRKYMETWKVKRQDSPERLYQMAYEMKKPVLLVEDRDLYEFELKGA